MDNQELDRRVDRHLKRGLGAAVIAVPLFRLLGLGAVIGYLFGRPAFLDIAIVYALINFVTTIALMTGSL